MKTFLLAAGLGTRLKPYTDTLPKCLIPIAGKPLLEIWFDHLRQFGVRDVLINTHHHAEQVTTFVQHYGFCHDNMRIAIHHEPVLLGSAGTLWYCRDFVDSQEDFMIIYADNLTNMNLQRFRDFHKTCRKSGAVLTMGLFHAPHPSACGIAEVDSNGRILDFEEKPEAPRSDLANAGIYMTSSEIFRYFPKMPSSPSGEVLDFGHHILPRLSGKMYGYPISGYLRDIGTLESYRLALSEWPVMVAATSEISADMAAVEGI